MFMFFFVLFSVHYIKQNIQKIKDSKQRIFRLKYLDLSHHQQMC